MSYQAQKYTMFPVAYFWPSDVLCQTFQTFHHLACPTLPSMLSFFVYTISFVFFTHHEQALVVFWTNGYCFAVCDLPDTQSIIHTDHHKMTSCGIM
jgi:hypothetical protein